MIKIGHWLSSSFINQDKVAKHRKFSECFSTRVIEGDVVTVLEQARHFKTTSCCARKPTVPHMPL